ncbi:PhnD/SsuA/transferrin family substrate-binding protein [Synechocystis sp. LKSZ1]|uniref:phosphate/phosphite/phosphonate ABC transporter substrate-binding protein n=1 Tax=Synechocystis sp. LKSZ1 TaxID=3144951 RepID=UPI00336C120D
MLLLLCTFALGACRSVPSSPPDKLSIGVVNLESSDRQLEQYTKLKDYLSQKLNSLVELEPTYNEIQALTQIQAHRWDLVFAPPGVVALAIAKSRYRPIFAMEGRLENRSVLIVRQDSPIQVLKELNGKKVAFGQPGSATGYYLPLFNLYGLTLAEAALADTPKTIMGWVAQQRVDAGALSQAEFNRYRTEFPQQKFRILYTDNHPVPSGAVLLSPNLEAKQQAALTQALADNSPTVAASAGYLPEAPVPSYSYLIQVVERVAPIAQKINLKPAPLYE